MAESMLIAFGRYLKLLRERRGLSLEDVTTLTASYPDAVSKSYLSRVEHGQCRIGFSKMIALGRAYDIPIEVVAERLTLDLEVEKIDMPKTDGLGFDDRIALANKAIRSGKHWVGYAVARDAAPFSDGATKPASFFAGNAKSTAASTSAACARALGKNTYALHEFTHLKDNAGDDPKTKIAALQQLASLWLFLGRPDAAEANAESAVRLARAQGLPVLLAYSLDALGNACVARQLPEKAISAYQEAIRILRDLEHEGIVGHVLLNLANVYFSQHRHGAARRALESASRILTKLDRSYEIVRGRVLLAEIAIAEQNHREAKKALRDAIDRARRLGMKNWVFKGEFLLYKIAIAESDSDVAVSLRRRLARLAPAVATELDELRQFRAETSRAE